jgi:PleD family two-component response regulator
MAIARAANAAVGALELGPTDAGNHRVTISAGVAMLDDVDAEPPSVLSLVLIEAADAALYRAKANGRDQVALAWSSPAPEHGIDFRG